MITSTIAERDRDRGTVVVAAETLPRSLRHSANHRRAEHAKRAQVSPYTCFVRPDRSTARLFDHLDLRASQDTPRAYAEARQTISTFCDYLSLPSLAVALITGLLSMVAHRPFIDTRWAWLKALLGLSMFEATFSIVQSKATTAAVKSAKVITGEGPPGALANALANEWWSLGAIMALSIAQIVLGVWRPRFAKR
jgi:hypothetical protein